MSTYKIAGMNRDELLNEHVLGAIRRSRRRTRVVAWHAGFAAASRIYLATLLFALAMVICYIVL